MDSPTENSSLPRNYYVDEAGDGTLFDRKGRVITGTEGCSRFFILGLVDIPDPVSLGRELEELRARLLADPYFKGVPSMRPDGRKTALAFHAKNGLPEVRREVFSLLLRHDSGFFAVVRRKASLLEYVRGRNARDPDYRYNANELYDYLVRRLFRERLHKYDDYRVHFARRGKADRTAALRKALEAARRGFAEQHGVNTDASIEVIPCWPARCPGVQVADYFLWALQRLYERGEERFVELLWRAFRLVHDMDDTREARYGVCYTQEKPLNAAAVEGLQGI